MAQKATVFKATINIADMDRHYYDEHQLTIARHPSETDLRMMTRVAVYALNAQPHLSFTKGISTDDEPDLWVKDYSDHIDCWIELGQPDIKRLRQACGKASQVKVYCYNASAAQLWWEQNQSLLQRLSNLTIINLNHDAMAELATLAQRNMSLHCSIQEEILSISDGTHNIDINQQVLMHP